jgi:hypothetical protein
MATASGADHNGPRRKLFTERISITADAETQTQLEKLRDILPASPTQSQVVRYAIRELYYRETKELR